MSLEGDRNVGNVKKRSPAERNNRLYLAKQLRGSIGEMVPVRIYDSEMPLSSFNISTIKEGIGIVPLSM